MINLAELIAREIHETIEYFRDLIPYTSICMSIYNRFERQVQIFPCLPESHALYT